VTSNSSIALAPADRLRRLEGPVGDFPYYAGAPVGISGAQWLLVMAAVAVGFAVLVVPIPWPAGPLGAMIPALLFPLIPLAALAYVAPRHWTAIFGKVGWRELRLMVGFALLNLVVSMGVGAIVSAFTEVTPNAAIAQLAGMDTAGRIAFLAKTAPQLFGEEVITVLPFLALMYALTKWLGVGRRRAIVGAWLVSSLVFGLLHLPTYDWNFVQSIVVIGTARMVLTLAYIMTKNIWVSTGAHVVNDWLLFALGVLGAGLVAQ
jgi:membrane protease YdiL (CAAX protease family)